MASNPAIDGHMPNRTPNIRFQDMTSRRSFKALESTGAVLSIVLLGWLIVSAFHAYFDGTIAREREIRITELSGRILQLDEVLTMSARLGATTGDSAWEKRYRKFEPDLDAAIKEMRNLSEGRDQEDYANETDAANMALVEMEHAAFRWVRQGRLRRASAEVFSPRYLEQKRIYSLGTDKFIKSLQEEMKESRRKEENFLYRSVIIEGVIIVLMIILSFRIKKTKELDARNEKLSAIGVLAAGVAHELNNPLGTILGYAEIMAAELSPGVNETPVRVIIAESRRCRTLIQDLLSLARSGTAKPVRQDLGEIARKAATLLRPIALKTGCRLELGAFNGPSFVNGKGDSLLQAVLNLATNALHAAGPQGGVFLRGGASGRAGKAGVWLEVEDDGPGVPAELRAKIFEPFFTTKPLGQGTGLGLSITHQIVENHGGTLELSRRDRKTVFTMWIPAA